MLPNSVCRIHSSRDLQSCSNLEMSTENSLQFETKFDDTSSVKTGYAVLQTIVCLILLPTSLTLIFGIVHYEHFGVDSKKRSFFNRSISAWFATIGLVEIFIFPTVTVRCWTGPMGHNWGLIVTITRRFLLISAAFQGVEILLYKSLCILYPTLITRLRDDFWMNFCSGFNTIFGIILSNGEWYLRTNYHPPIYIFISGEGDINTTSKQ